MIDLEVSVGYVEFWEVVSFSWFEEFYRDIGKVDEISVFYF